MRNFLKVVFLLVVTICCVRCDPSCPATAADARFDCYPESAANGTANEADCLARGCCWDPIPNQNISGPHRPEYPNTRYPIHVGAPSCFYPQGYPTYSYTSFQKTTFGYTSYLSRSDPSPYPNDVSQLRLDVFLETHDRFRVKISDANYKRYEVPWPTMPTPGPAANDTLYSVAFDANLGFIISRKSTQEVLFEATVGSWIFSDQFIQLSARLPNTNLYGLSQHNDNFKRSFDWQLIPLFASQLYPDYGSHPFYLMMENSQFSHGVFIFNSNAMDILLQPTPAITYRVTGGILDFYFFLGPSPNEVIQQYNDLIGHPIMPPYWSLGFHLCRYGYGSANATLDNWKNNKDAGIPFDAQWNDIDYMQNFRDFTFDSVSYSNIKDMVNEFHDNNYRYVVITDAGISQVEDGSYLSYEDGKAMDIFVKNSTGDGYATGQVWPEVSVFPDFTHPDIDTYWTNQFNRFHDDVPYDGAWIDMNEPTTFSSGSINNICTSSLYDNAPYQPDVEGGFLNAYTICMTSVQKAGSHYNFHNLYAFAEMNYTSRAMKAVLQKRPFVLSRSTAPGAGQFGTHWTGDIYSSWEDLRQSIPSLLNYNFYGFPMVGSDICGFRQNTTLELCKRWTQLGAFYPFARNHNEKENIAQDPASLGSEMIQVTIDAMNLRYSFLPFFYTQLYKAHFNGENAIRPLFFEFPEDSSTYDIQYQFMWAHHLMVIPILEESVNCASFYFPAGSWYLYPNNTRISSAGESLPFCQYLDGYNLNVALREGYVIPTQAPAQTTFLSRENPFTLLVVLDSNGMSEGELFWDDGDSIDTIENQAYNLIKFMALDNYFYVNSTINVDDLPLTVEKVVLYGLSPEPTTVTINSNPVDVFVYDPENLVLSVETGNVQIDSTTPNFQINWS